MRVTRSVLKDLALYSVGFGGLIGVIFPFFTYLVLGVREALSLTFWLMCILAGFTVGGFNFFLFDKVVGRYIKALSQRMQDISRKVTEMVYTHESYCPETCYLGFRSEDALGEIARSFNEMVDSIRNSFEIEMMMEAFSRELAAFSDLEALAQHITRRLIAYTDSLAGALFVREPGETEGKAFRLAFQEGFDPDRIREVLTPEALSKLRTARGPTLIRIPSEMVLDFSVVKVKAMHLYLLPVFQGERLLGGFFLAKTRPYTDRERYLLGTLAGQVGVALDNALAHEKLKILAAVDELTGAYNRRFGLLRLREEFSRALRTASPLSVLMLDLDHFKQINDQYGHAAGDLVLRMVAQTVRKSVREGDIVCRYGGEEFLVILPGATKEEAVLVAERIRSAVGELTIMYGGQAIRITVSIGVAGYPHRGISSHHDLIELADEALYRSKQMGRNMTYVAES